MKGPSRIIAPHSHPSHSGYSRYREWVVTKHPSLQLLNKLLVSVAGILVIVVGLILVPLPGPGWLVVFFGLSILGLEFPLFQRLTSWIGSKAKGIWSSLKSRHGAPRQSPEQSSASTT